MQRLTMEVFAIAKDHSQHVPGHELVTRQAFNKVQPPLVLTNDLYVHALSASLARGSVTGSW